MSQIGSTPNARTPPVPSGPQTHRPNSVEMQGLPHQERVRLKKQAHKMRFGTLNVGSMTGRAREVADLMNNRKVDILCVQEIKWSGNKVKEIGDGYKLIYSGGVKKKNGVGIILSKELKDTVVEVNRKDDRIMWLKLELKDLNINVFSIYAPQTGCPDEEKEKFWTDLQEEMEKVDDNEKCIVNGDLNGHIGTNNDSIRCIHGGNYFGAGNEDGERVIDLALSNDMVICNTIFNKRPEHLMTYKSGNRTSQIDFMLYRRRDRSEVQNCKVIPGDHVSAQHRLVTLDLSITVGRKQISKPEGLKKIKWFKLKDNALKEEFRDRVLRELNGEIDDIDLWWNETNYMILRQAKEVFGESNGKTIQNKETWWFNEEIQLKKEAKKNTNKRWKRWIRKHTNCARKKQRKQLPSLSVKLMTSCTKN